MHWYNDHQRRLVAALSAKSTSPLQTTPATDSPSLLTKLAPLALIHHHLLQAASSRMETCRITLLIIIIVLHASCEKNKKIIGSSTMHYV